MQEVEIGPAKSAEPLKERAANEVGEPEDREPTEMLVLVVEGSPASLILSGIVPGHPTSQTRLMRPEKR